MRLQNYFNENFNKNKLSSPGRIKQVHVHKTSPPGPGRIKQVYKTSSPGPEREGWRSWGFAAGATCRWTWHRKWRLWLWIGSEEIYTAAETEWWFDSLSLLREREGGREGGREREREVERERGREREKERESHDNLTEVHTCIYSCICSHLTI